MKRLALLVLLVVAAALSAWAQRELPRFDRPLPSDAEILRMRYRVFDAWAYEHAKQANEVQQDAVAEWYADLRERANEKTMAGRSWQVVVRNATRAVKRWAADRWLVISMQAGGGTMYTHASIREVAVIADVETDAIAAWTPYATALPGAVDSIQPFKATRPGRTDVNSTPAAQFARALSEEAASLQRAQAAVRRLPPGAEEAFARFMTEHAARGWRGM